MTRLLTLCSVEVKAMPHEDEPASGFPPYVWEPDPPPTAPKCPTTCRGRSCHNLLRQRTPGQHGRPFKFCSRRCGRSREVRE